MKLTVMLFFIRWFDTIKLFNRHVIKEHFEKQHQQAVCKWEGCDGLRRPKWSLMTHLQVIKQLLQFLRFPLKVGSFKCNLSVLE